MGGTHGQPTVLTIAAGLLAASVTPAQCDFRASLLDLARERINVWYQDENNLEPAQVKDGISYRLSKEDKGCGGTGVPLTFLDFKINGVRAVDAFNVLADADSQPKWDSSCDEMNHLADLNSKRARGYAGVFSAPGLLKLSREFYEFQVADANFTSEEFWVIFSTLENQDLREERSPAPGAVVGDNCLAAYRIRSVPDGVHIVVSQQLNGRPWPLTARYVAQMAFGTSVSFVQCIDAAAQKQAKLGWNATRSVLPDWMLSDGDCTAEAPNVNLQTSLLKRARSVLDGSDRGETQPEEQLPGGEVMQVWQQWRQCGNAAVASESVPMWQAEFRIPSAEPDEVFNVIANKAQEPQWNSNVNRVRVEDFSSGANGGVRGVHEELAVPPGLASWMSYPREFWEWQATNHSLENKSYLMVLASTSKSASPAFESSNVEGAQCLAAYEVSPASKGGTHVRMVTHPNPHVFVLLRAFTWIWSSMSRKMLGQYAAELTAEAQRVAGARGSFGKAVADGGILALLSPSAPGRNRSASVAHVLEAKDDDLLSKFAELDLPHVLNTSTWEHYHLHAENLSRLGKELKANMTHMEDKHFRGDAAADEIDVQIQGEVLSNVQMRVIQQLAVDDCAGSLPDPDNDMPEDGGAWQLMLGGAVTVLLLSCAAIVCCCVRCRRRIRLKRELALATANALLPESCAQGDSTAGPEVGAA